MADNTVRFLFLAWFLFIIAWNRISMSLSRSSINIICGGVIVANLGMFWLIRIFFKAWLLIFYAAVGAFLLYEKFEKKPVRAHIRRESVSLLQDCIVIIGTLMIVFGISMLCWR